MTSIPKVKNPGTFQLWQWISDPVKYLHDCDHKYGDTFAVQMSGLFKGVIFTGNPAAVQQLLTSDTKQFIAPGSSNKIFAAISG